MAWESIACSNGPFIVLGFDFRSVLSSERISTPFGPLETDSSKRITEKSLRERGKRRAGREESEGKGERGSQAKEEKGTKYDRVIQDYRTLAQQ